MFVLPPPRPPLEVMVLGGAGSAQVLGVELSQMGLVPSEKEALERPLRAPIT